MVETMANREYWPPPAGSTATTISGAKISLVGVTASSERKNSTEI